MRTNVEAERGFSINKNMLDCRSSMCGRTLTSTRLVKDTILLYNNYLTLFPITSELVHSCKKAYSNYERDQKSKKDLMQLEKEEN